MGTRENKDLGKKLNHLAGREISILGARLDNYPETVQLKRLLAAEDADIEHGLTMIHGGKRHFLNHEKKSAEILLKVLNRFNFAMYFPGSGQKREKELLFIIASHMKGTLAFMPELKGTKSRMPTEKRASSLVWDICWDGRDYNYYLISDFIQLWKADYNAGKLHSIEEDRVFEDIQSLLTETGHWQKENIENIDWDVMHSFMREKKITGEAYGEFKACVLREAILTKNIKLTPPFLSAVFANLGLK
jgi:poly(A) polymerase